MKNGPVFLTEKTLCGQESSTTGGRKSASAVGDETAGTAGYQLHN